MEHATQFAGNTAVPGRARRRIARRIMPYLFALYIIAFLDRVNVSYAALDMTKALGFSPQVYGFGAGIFFIGYFLLEIPGSFLLEQWSAGKWIARISISLGLAAELAGFIHTATQFYWVRFFLGISEAGFFPGIIVYLSHWFRWEDRAKAVATFMAAQPVANIIGAPVSGWIMRFHWLGLEGWRWLFVLEGLPAIVFGFVTLSYLTDWPAQAAWLSEDERRWIITELESERRAKEARRPYRVSEALRQPSVILLALAYFGITTSVYGFNFWLPTIIKKLSGASNTVVTLISALPFCVGLAAMVLVGWSSDRSGERRWHTATCMAVASAGLLLSVFFQDKAALAVLMFCVTAVGMYGYLPGFWSLPSSFLTGTAAAVSVGLINSIGNLGGFVGPYIVGYLSKTTEVSFAGMIYLSLSAGVAAVLIISLRTSQQQRRIAAEGAS